MPVLRTVLRPALVVTLLLCATACGGDPPAAVPDRSPTSIAQLDVASMRVVRVAFCDLVPKPAVQAALRGTPTRARSWHNGDKVLDAGGELGQEFGCAWFGPHGRSARAWVFARPVTPAFARSLVSGATRDRGCQARSEAGFGSPALVQTCVHPGGPTRIRHAGLFGQTWLTCEVGGAGKVAQLRARAEAWCASVADALDAGHL